MKFFSSTMNYFLRRKRATFVQSPVYNSNIQYIDSKVRQVIMKFFTPTMELLFAKKACRLLLYREMLYRNYTCYASKF